MWFRPLPVAITPLWQLAQGPLTTLWSIRACAKRVVVWQVSQLTVVGMCVLDFPEALMPSWQAAHSVGVPLKRPR